MKYSKEKSNYYIFKNKGCGAGNFCLCCFYHDNKCSLLRKLNMTYKVSDEITYEYCFDIISKKKNIINISETKIDNYILKHRGCFVLNCSKCFYKTVNNQCSITKKIQDKNVSFVYMNYDKIRYDYVLDKKKIEKLKEILS